MKTITISDDLAARYDSEDARVSDAAMREIRRMLEEDDYEGQIEISHPEGFTILSGLSREGEAAKYDDREYWGRYDYDY